MSVKYQWVTDPKTGRRYQVDERGTERPQHVSDLDERDIQKHKDTSLDAQAQYPRIAYLVDPDDGEITERRVESAEAHAAAKKEGFVDAVKQGKGGEVLKGAKAAAVAKDDAAPAAKAKKK